MEPRFPHNPNGLVTVPKGEAESARNISALDPINNTTIGQENSSQSHKQNDQARSFITRVEVDLSGSRLVRYGGKEI